MGSSLTEFELSFAKKVGLLEGGGGGHRTVCENESKKIRNASDETQVTRILVEYAIFLKLTRLYGLTK